MIISPVPFSTFVILSQILLTVHKLRKVMFISTTKVQSWSRLLNCQDEVSTCLPTQSSNRAQSVSWTGYILNAAMSSAGNPVSLRIRGPSSFFHFSHSVISSDILSTTGKRWWCCHCECLSKFNTRAVWLVSGYEKKKKIFPLKLILLVR